MSIFQENYRFINLVSQLCIDYFYIKSIKYLPQDVREPKFVTDGNLPRFHEYLKKDGTYRKSLPFFSVLNIIKPEAAKSNLKCNAYALRILNYSGINNENIDKLISFLNEESKKILDSKKFSSNEIFNIIQVISTFIEIKDRDLAACLFHKLHALNIEWKTLPYFIQASYLVVCEQLISQHDIIDASEFGTIANDLYTNISIDKINLNNSFTEQQGFSSHELGYFLYFSIQLNYVKNHPLVYKAIIAIVEKLHILFIREKIIFDDGSKQKKMVNNSGVALISWIFFQSSILMEDPRYGNAGLFLMDYLIANQNRYLGLLPSSLPVWGRKSPFQFPLWTQYYLLLAMRKKTNFLDSLK